MTNKFIKLKIPIYNDILFVSVNQTNEEVQDCFKRNKLFIWEDFEKSDYGGRCMYYSTSCVGVIRVVNQKNDIKNMSYLIHELMHYVSSVLRYRGLPHTDASEEAYTYLTDYLVKEVCAKVYPNMTLSPTQGIRVIMKKEKKVMKKQNV